MSRAAFIASRILLALLPAAALLDALAPRLFDTVFVSLALLSLFRHDRARPAFFTFHLWGFLYVAVAVVASVRGTISGTLDDPWRALPVLARTIELLLLVPLVSLHLSSAGARDRFARILGACAFLFAVGFLIWQAVVLSGATSDFRAHGLMERGAGVLTILAPVLLVIGLGARRPFAVASAALLLVLQFLSGARMVAVAGLAGVCAVALCAPGLDRRVRAGAITLGLLLFALLAPVTIASAFGSLRSPVTHGPEHGRYETWSEALGEARATPLCGRGPGAAARWYHEGDWVRLLHETGALGLFFALAMVVSLGRSLWERRARPLACGLLGAWLSLLLRSFSGSPFLRASDGAFFLLLVALALLTPAAENDSAPAA